MSDTHTRKRKFDVTAFRFNHHGQWLAKHVTSNLQQMARGNIVNVDGQLYNPRLWVGELVTMTLAAAPLSRSNKTSR